MKVEIVVEVGDELVELIREEFGSQEEVRSVDTLVRDRLEEVMDIEEILVQVINKVK